MKLRNDIDPATTWVWSDTHFSHANIAKYCHRPVDHEEIMLEELKVVPEEDTLLHLGDINYTRNSLFKNVTAKKLRGKRRLIIQGNHDPDRTAFYRQAGLQRVAPFFIHYGWHTGLCPTCHGLAITHDGDPCSCGYGGHSLPYQVSFSHYPASHRLLDHQVRLHGHIHNNGYTRTGFVPFLRNHVNLSVEQTKYRPVNLKLLLDAYLFGEYTETTPEQRQGVADRKAANLERKSA